jgi:glutaredoxin
MIEIYGKSNCGWCKKAVALADQYMLQYRYHNCDDSSHALLLKERFPEVKTVPQIWWNDKHLGGYQQFAKEIEETMGSNYGQEVF